MKKALIIGCGIAGPVLALFLKLAGIEAEIYEAREVADGFALSLSCNGVGVLQELGLDGPVFSAGSAVTGWQMWNWKGKRLVDEGILADGEIKSVFIKRVPLGLIIADEAERQGIKIWRGKKLQSIETTDSGGVIATFQDGTTAHGDFLVGADGVHSRTRQLIDPTFPGAVFTGLMNSGGYTSNVKVSSPPETIHFNFGKRAFLGYHVSQTGYIYWFVNWLLADEPKRGAFDGMTEKERREQLSGLFSEDRPLLREIIQGADEIFPYFASYALPTQPASWHKGPVVLLGDAAHAISPSSGQGASMALEDAAILAKCVRDIPTLEQAFAIYEQLRRERTARMFKVGEQGDAGKHAVSPMQQWLRDLMTPIFVRLFANPKASRWMYAYRVDWDQPIALGMPASYDSEKATSTSL